MIPTYLCCWSLDILTTGLAHCMAVAIYPRDRSRSGAALSHVSGGGVRKTPAKSTQHDFFTEATIATVRLAADKFQTDDLIVYLLSGSLYNAPDLPRDLKKSYPRIDVSDHRDKPSLAANVAFDLEHDVMYISTGEPGVPYAKYDETPPPLEENELKLEHAERTMPWRVWDLSLATSPAG